MPDTLEGRFAVLATILALLSVRLERGGDDADQLSIGLAERFIESMDSDIRQMGIGDPAIGKQVRSLVGALAARVERWRAVLGNPDSDWSPAVLRSIYRDRQPAVVALAHSIDRLRALWQAIESADVTALGEGKLP